MHLKTNIGYKLSEIVLFKRKPQALNNVTQIQFPNQGLILNIITVSFSSRNSVLTVSQDFFNHTNESAQSPLHFPQPQKEDQVICIRPLAFPPRQAALLETILFFCFLAPSSFYKNLPLCTTPQSALYLLDRMLTD